MANLYANPSALTHLISTNPPALSCASFNSPKAKHSTVVCGARSDIPSAQKENDGLQLKLNRRTALSLLSFTVSIPLVGLPAFGLLEADDDTELLEKAKEDRKKRLQRREQDNLLKIEAAHLQDAVYKLSEIGKAIDNNDFSSASRVLGTSLDTKWIVKVKEAFSKVSTNYEAKNKAETFIQSLASLISAVSMQNLDSSKKAFVSSANALENWFSLTGLSGQLKGL